ncbi:MAG: ribonuclease D [Tractidigestivibacter sp.]|uniref:ribonuclease D n=1 Tax=Tractidigestivibacter sp. TaxID=2847320 RepID=UPI003D94823C
MYISTSDELRDFCDKIRGARVVAVDTEFLREKTYRPLLCLIQVGTKDQIGAVDPLLVDDLTPLAEVFADESVTKVFHACGQDLEAIYDTMGVICKPVFDTQVAAAFLGMRQQTSYAAVVEGYCNVHLPKAESLTDWSHRPLDPEQLVYAEDDVRYLPAIYDAMIDKLVRKDRLSWVEPEMAALTELSRVRKDPREAYLKLRRSNSLTRRQLAIAREVCAWREETASKRNVPKKWIVSDEVLVEVCRRAPKNVQSLRKIRGTEQLSAKDGAALVEAVAAGERVPASECPSHEKHYHATTEIESVVDLMYALVRLVSEQSGVAAQLIATRDDLAGFIRDRKSSPLLVGWRKELVGDKLVQLLEGETGLTVREGRVEFI